MTSKPAIFDLFNLFWSKAEMKDFKPQDGMTFFCMIHACNRQDWANPFSLSNKRAALLIGVSEKTLIECRARLQQRGLLQFKPGKRKQASPTYCLPVKSEDGSFYFPWESKTVSKTESKTVSKTESKTVSYINNIITDDIITATTATPLQEADAVGLNNSKKPKKRKRPPAESPPLPPAIEEVYAYFEKMNAPERITDWQTSATMFYNSYAANGWKNKYGTSIIGTWKIVVNNWILYREQDLKNRKNEIKQTDKFSERRGTEPSTASRKGFKGTF